METRDVIEALNNLLGEQVRAADTVELRRLSALCDHWHKMAYAEARCRRKYQAAQAAE